MGKDWKLFLILLITCIFRTIAVLPYTISLQGELLQNLPVPLYVLLAAQLIQSVILFGVDIPIGLQLSTKLVLFKQYTKYIYTS